MTIFKDSHHFSRTLGDVWWQSLRAAITSVELWAMFDDNLQRQPSLQQNFGRCLMTRFKDSHHFSRTLGDVWWESLRTATTSVELWTMFDDNPYSTTPYHKVLDFTTVLSTQPAGSDERVARRHYKFAFYHNFERPTRTKSREGCHSTTPYDKVLDFTTVLSTQTAGSDERVARRH